MLAATQSWHNSYAPCATAAVLGLRQQQSRRVSAAPAFQQAYQCRKKGKLVGRRWGCCSTVQMAAKRILNYAFEWRGECSRCRNATAAAAATAAATTVGVPVAMAFYHAFNCK